MSCGTVVGRVGGVIHDAAVGVGEADEASILDAAALALAHRKDHPFGQRRVGRKIEVVVGVGEPEHAAGHLLKG